MESSTIPYDANQVVTKREVDDTNGIEAVRAAWSCRTDGFRALYLEQGEISNETDARVAEILAHALRAPVTAPVVGHFRREIGMKAYERRARPGETIALPPPTELPFDPSARPQSVSEEVYIAAHALPALIACAYSGLHDDQIIQRIAMHAAEVGRATLRALRGVTPRGVES